MADERIAKIKDTQLGFEDHGIFTAWLHLDYGDAGQGAGGFYLEKIAGPFIIGVLRACGVDRWERLRGRTVIALIEGGMVRGIKPLPTEPGTPFMFAEATTP